jgi:hypothetical protein
MTLTRASRVIPNGRLYSGAVPGIALNGNGAEPTARGRAHHAGATPDEEAPTETRVKVLRSRISVCNQHGRSGQSSRRSA